MFVGVIEAAFEGLLEEGPGGGFRDEAEDGRSVD